MRFKLEVDEATLTNKATAMRCVHFMIHQTAKRMQQYLVEHGQDCYHVKGGWDAGSLKGKHREALEAIMDSVKPKTKHFHYVIDDSHNSVAIKYADIYDTTPKLSGYGGRSCYYRVTVFLCTKSVDKGINHDRVFSEPAPLNMSYYPERVTMPMLRSRVKKINKLWQKLEDTKAELSKANYDFDELIEYR